MIGEGEREVGRRSQRGSPNGYRTARTRNFSWLKRKMVRRKISPIETILSWLRGCEYRAVLVDSDYEGSSYSVLQDSKTPPSLPLSPKKGSHWCSTWSRRIGLQQEEGWEKSHGARCLFEDQHQNRFSRESSMAWSFVQLSKPVASCFCSPYRSTSRTTTPLLSSKKATLTKYSADYCTPAFFLMSKPMGQSKKK